MKRLAPLLAVVALAVACTPGGDDTAATTTDGGATSTAPATTAPVTTAPATTGTTSGTSTSSSSTTTSSTSSSIPTCPSGPAVPGGADGFESIAVDLDLDASVDTVSTYRVEAADAWHLRVEWGGGGSTDTVIAGVGAFFPARPIGAVDVEGDTSLELFAVVGSGASSTLIGLFDVDGCALDRVTLGGAPAVFPVGASAGNVSGLSCEGVGDLDRLFASNNGGGNWEGGFEPHSLAGSVLTAGPGDGATFTDGEAAALAVLDCPPLSL